MEYYKKVNLVNEAIKEGILLLQVMKVNSNSNNLIKINNYDDYSNKYHNQNDKYIFYVNGALLFNIFKYELVEDIIKCIKRA